MRSRVAGVARKLRCLEVSDSGATADVNQFRVLHEDVLHLLLGSNGDDFLGLDGSDHDALREEN